MNKIYGVILGRSSLLSTAEVLSRSNNSAKIVAWDREFCMFEGCDISQSLQNMGGVQKYFEVLRIVDKEKIIENVKEIVGEITDYEGGSGKYPYAINVYGMYKKYQKPLLQEIKNLLEQKGIKARFIHRDMNKNAPTARLLSEKVIQKGFELILCQKGQDIFIGRSMWIQNINEYTKRDMDKPVRDMHTGMLPPKLAQIMISLLSPYITKETVLWDQFCGSGVLLMEALRERVKIIGSDIEEGMVEKSKQNVDWYKRLLGTGHTCEFIVADATKPEIYQEMQGKYEKLCICTEGYLGKNFTHAPRKEDFFVEKKKLEEIYFDLVFAMKNGLKLGTVVCLLIPFYPSLKQEGRLTSVLTSIQKVGGMILPLVPKELYHRMDRRETHEYTYEQTYLYSREDQFVGREIVLFML